jgi:hypothetical protein
MKKFAMLAVAGFIASSLVACGDDSEEDDDDDGTPAIQLPGSWGSTSGSVKLGNGNKGSAGSFLDVDEYPLVAIKKADAAAKKNDIDVILTGDKLITPKGCSSVSFCSTEMSGTTNEAALFIDVSTSTLTATSSPSDIQALLQNVSEDDLKNSVNAQKDGKYIMFTSYESGDSFGLAYIVINGEVGDNAMLTVGTVIVP